ncbi:MAG: hypothetical protein PWQ18_495, partial [Clostridia bacterium]|nr:hypothetical protein [Clostridia bacterium]
EELRVILLTLPHELFLRFLLSQAAGYTPAAKLWPFLAERHFFTFLLA